MKSRMPRPTRRCCAAPTSRLRSSSPARCGVITCALDSRWRDLLDRDQPAAARARTFSDNGLDTFRGDGAARQPLLATRRRRERRHAIPARPGAEQDGIYGRDFSVVCLCVRDDVFLESLTNAFPELLASTDRQWRVSEPSDAGRKELIEQFAEAAAILRADDKVRRSFAARSVMQDELLGAFLETLAGGVEQSPMPTVANAAALVGQAEDIAGNVGIKPLHVSDLCVRCRVPRRTLSHAFHQVLGMGPATYLRRLRLNQVRRSLRQNHANARPATVTELALEHGFWHLGRFSSQYREFFGENPQDCPTLRHSRAIPAAGRVHPPDTPHRTESGPESCAVGHRLGKPCPERLSGAAARAKYRRQPDWNEPAARPTRARPWHL